MVAAGPNEKALYSLEKQIQRVHSVGILPGQENAADTGGVVSATKRETEMDPEGARSCCMHGLEQKNVCASCICRLSRSSRSTAGRQPTPGAGCGPSHTIAREHLAETAPLFGRA